MSELFVPEKCCCIVGFKPNASCPQHGDAVATTSQSNRAVLDESWILNLECPNCYADPGKPCRTKERQPLAFAVGDTELRFHKERILDAWYVDLCGRFPNIPLQTDQFLLTHYAYVILASAVSVSAKKIFGKEFTPLEIQKFFYLKAMEELKKDRLL